MITRSPSARTPVALPPRVSLHSPAWSAPGYFFQELRFQTTSAGVKSVPSLHFTPCRMVKTSCVGDVHVYAVANHGRIAHVNESRIIRGS